MTITLADGKKWDVYTNGKVYAQGDQYFTITESEPAFKKARQDKVIYNHQTGCFVANDGGSIAKAIRAAYGLK